MRRISTSFALLGLLTTVASAQPAPPAPPEAPAPPDAPLPPVAPPADAPPSPEAPLPPLVPVAPVPAAGVAATPGPAVESRPEKKLAVGTKGLFQPGLLAQGWFVADRSNGATPLSTFRLRRAEIAVKGDILPKRVSYQIMFDPAKVRETQRVTVAGPADAMGNPTTVTINNPVSAISVLQDFYITFVSTHADVSIGQFKIPVSWEGLNSSSKIILPERAIVSSLFGDKRDLGMRIAKQFARWGYHAGIYNGQGLNNLDTNNQKDVALRLEAYPVKGLTLAGVTYDSIGYRSRAGTKDRWEGDVRYESGPLLVQAEYIRARDIAKDGADAVTAHGFYAAVGYTLKELVPHGDLQPVVRVGYVDPDTSKDLDPTMGTSDELWHYDVGASYFLQGHEMKLQASYQRQQFQTKPAVNEVIVAAQVWY